MTTISYEIIGEHSAPEDFMNELYRTLLTKSRKVPLVAKRVNVDDLAAKRGESNTQIEFNFLIDILDPSGSSVSGVMYIGKEKGPWILIQTDAATGRLQFDTFE